MWAYPYLPIALSIDICAISTFFPCSKRLNTHSGGFLWAPEGSMPTSSPVGSMGLCGFYFKSQCWVACSADSTRTPPAVQESSRLPFPSPSQMVLICHPDLEKPSHLIYASLLIQRLAVFFKCLLVAVCIPPPFFWISWFCLKGQLGFIFLTIRWRGSRRWAPWSNWTCQLLRGSLVPRYLRAPGWGWKGRRSVGLAWLSWEYASDLPWGLGVGVLV